MKNSMIRVCDIALSTIAQLQSDNQMELNKKLLQTAQLGRINNAVTIDHTRREYDVMARHLEEKKEEVLAVLRVLHRIDFYIKNPNEPSRDAWIAAAVEGVPTNDKLPPFPERYNTEDEAETFTERLKKEMKREE